MGEAAPLRGGGRGGVGLGVASPSPGVLSQRRAFRQRLVRVCPAAGQRLAPAVQHLAHHQGAARIIEHGGAHADLRRGVTDFTDKQRLAPLDWFHRVRRDRARGERTQRRARSASYGARVKASPVCAIA